MLAGFELTPSAPLADFHNSRQARAATVARLVKIVQTGSKASARVGAARPGGATSPGTCWSTSSPARPSEESGRRMCLLPLVEGKQSPRPAFRYDRVPNQIRRGCFRVRAVLPNCGWRYRRQARLAHFVRFGRRRRFKNRCGPECPGKGFQEAAECRIGKRVGRRPYAMQGRATSAGKAPRL